MLDAARDLASRSVRSMYSWASSMVDGRKYPYESERMGTIWLTLRLRTICRICLTVDSRVHCTTPISYLWHPNHFSLLAISNCVIWVFWGHSDSRRERTAFSESFIPDCRAALIIVCTPLTMLLLGLSSGSSGCSFILQRCLKVRPSVDHRLSRK